MKSVAAVLATLCFCLVASLPAFSETSDPIIVVFYQEGCNSCDQLDQFLDPLLFEAPTSALVRYEISEPESQRLLEALSKAYKENPASYPVVFVGSKVFCGELSRGEEATISDIFERCLRYGCESPIARLPISQLRADLPRLALFLAVFLALTWLQLH
jgi:thiol-disulfide isomerase/thioredoxin